MGQTVNFLANRLRVHIAGVVGFCCMEIVWWVGGSLNDQEYTFCLFFAGFLLLLD